MAQKSQLKDPTTGEKIYPVTSSSCVGMSDGSGTLDNRLQKMTTEYNVSAFKPTSGPAGDNKYTLETAIAQVPAELRTFVNTVSFLNQAGKTEKWEFGGGSWIVGSFSQVGSEKLIELNNKVDNLGYIVNGTIIKDETFEGTGYINRESSSTFSIEITNIPTSNKNEYKVEVVSGQEHITPRKLTIVVNDSSYYYGDIGNLVFESDYSAKFTAAQSDIPIKRIRVQVGIPYQISSGSVQVNLTGLNDGVVQKEGLLERVEKLEGKPEIIVENEKGSSTQNPISQDFVTKELYGSDDIPIEEENYYESEIVIDKEKTAVSTISQENIPESVNNEYRIEITEGQEHITKKQLTVVVNGSSYYIPNPYGDYSELKFESDYSATFKLIDSDIPPRSISLNVGLPYQVTAGKAKFKLSNVVKVISNKGIHGDIETLQNELSTTDGRVKEIDSRVEKLEKNSSSGDTSTGDSSSTPNLPSIHICDLIDCVVGDTIQLYYNMFVHHIGDYSLNIECPKGKNYPRYWEYTPTSNDVGSTKMKIQLLNIDGSVIQEKTISIVTKNATNPSSAKNILLVGDSLYMSGQIAIELSRRLKGTVGVATSPAALELSNFNIVGRLKNSDGTVGWEGTGGWTWNTYTGRDGLAGARLTVSGITDVRVTQSSIYKIEGFTQQVYLSEVNVTDGSGYVFAAFYGQGDIYKDHSKMPSEGKLIKQSGEGQQEINFSASQVVSYQPFWNTETDSFDIKGYVDLYCDGHLEILCVQLGINSIIGANPFTTDFSTTVLAKAKAFIDLVHSQLPETKIYIATLPLPSQNGGIGANYAAGNASGSYLTASFNYKVHKTNDLYRSLLEDENYNTFVSVIDVCSEMDADNNYPVSNSALNTRNTATEPRGTNGVHPANPGYYQISDTWLRAVV